jgi:hypothetical protein
MTCQELHNYFDSDLHIETDLLPDAELAKHIATCPECNRFTEEHKELEEHLGIVRDSAPPIPASLGNAVVANYRRYLWEQSCSARSIPATHRIYPRAVLGWLAAMAFAAVVAYEGMLLFIARQHVWVDRPATVRQSMAPEAKEMASKETARTQIITRKVPGSHGDSGKRANNPAPLAEKDNSLPTRFQSLMYCDQISCAGAMDVIRVQLPSPVMGVTPTSPRMGGAVSADVLVGPDGIARGIRVVE